MSAEASELTNTVANTEAWTQWEGKVVNGAYLLRRFLGCSNQSGVFLTEHHAENRPEVAIKFIPAETVQAEAQLVQWAATTTLVHPNLVRIFDVGRYRHGGREYLYIVTEYADQTLAEILPRRPLAPEEVRELLLPTIDALLFLHRKGLVHGRLKPSNFMAVNDQLKLASDSIRPVNHTASGRDRMSAYDPPEVKDRALNAAGDIWGLGMTLLEALTQRTTAWPDESVSVPADLPGPFASIVLRCLSVAPAARPTALDIEASFKQAAPARPTSPAPPPARQPSSKVAPPKHPQQQNPWRRALAASVPLSVVGWAAWHVLGNAPEPTPSPAPAPVVATPAPVAASTVAKPVEPTPTPAPEASPAVPAETVSGAVLHEVKPDVPQAALEKIKGRVHVSVRVLVDADGDVVGALLDEPGASKYFVDLAEQAAGEWKFVPAAGQDTRVWILLFVFSRNGVTTYATAQ